MKKAVMLILVTVCCILLIGYAGVFYKSSIVKVDAVTAGFAQGVEYVSCTGNIEYTNEKPIYAKSATLTDEVLAASGCTVSKGDVLMRGYSATGTSSELTYLTDHLLEIQAPVSGTVVSVRAKAGEFLYPGEKAFVIANSDEMQVRLFVNEANISAVKTGQKTRITGSGFQNTYTGTVSEISSEAVQSASSAGGDTSVEVLVRIDHPAAELKPGLTSSVKIITSQEKQSLILPYETVKADEFGKEYVYTIQDGRAVQTPVITGKEFSNGFEILDGISEKDQIVLQPDLVSDGTHVFICQEEQ